MSTYLDLVAAREEASRRLSLLREAEQIVRDRRDDFELAKNVVRRFKKRNDRAVAK